MMKPPPIRYAIGGEVSHVDPAMAECSPDRADDPNLAPDFLKNMADSLREMRRTGHTGFYLFRGIYQFAD